MGSKFEPTSVRTAVSYSDRPTCTFLTDLNEMSGKYTCPAPDNAVVEEMRERELWPRFLSDVLEVRGYPHLLHVKGTVHSNIFYVSGSLHYSWLTVLKNVLFKKIQHSVLGFQF